MIIVLIRIKCRKKNLNWVFFPILLKENEEQSSQIRIEFLNLKRISKNQKYLLASTTSVYVSLASDKSKIRQP